MEYIGFKNEYHSGKIHIYNGDCMDLLRQTPDKYYDLALVDPPYGIGISSNSFRQKHKKLSWDNEVPADEYFKELFRVSSNQKIWGGNYFNLGASQGFLIWDKMQPFDFSSAMCEMAWTSFQKPAKIYRKHVVTAEKNKIHPTQKPVDLYKFILHNYAKEGDTILDTHFGSLSIGIACHDMGFELTAIELDEDYYEAGKNRLINHQRQLNLFK